MEIIKNIAFALLFAFTIFSSCKTFPTAFSTPDHCIIHQIKLIDNHGLIIKEFSERYLLPDSILRLDIIDLDYQKIKFSCACEDDDDPMFNYDRVVFVKKVKGNNPMLLKCIEY